MRKAFGGVFFDTERSLRFIMIVLLLIMMIADKCSN